MAKHIPLIRRRREKQLLDELQSYLGGDTLVQRGKVGPGPSTEDRSTCEIFLGTHFEAHRPSDPEDERLFIT